MGRSLADFGRLSPAERTLRDCCKNGEEATIGPSRPTRGTRTNRVRAAFVRFLILGGDDSTPVHEHGVNLSGAWLTGALDLVGTKVDRGLALLNCRIEQVYLDGAGLRTLDLTDSWILAGFSGVNLSCQQNVSFQRTRIRGGVQLASARLGGDLICVGARLRGTDFSLSMESATIEGSVMLTDGFSAAGRVSLINTSIAGALDCTRGSFSSASDFALSLDCVRVATTFLFRFDAKVTGAMDLAGMKVAMLCDDEDSWKASAGRLALDGFVYDRLAGVAPTSAEARIAWLNLQREDFIDSAFRPQPWEQLIAVLRSMGHPKEARLVAIAKQDQLRRAGKIPKGARSLHWLYGKLVGYGYRPGGLVKGILAVWLLCGAFYWVAASPGVLGERPALVAKDAAADPPGSFNPFLYSADVLLPIVDFGYADRWNPALTQISGQSSFWAYRARDIRWLEIALGWLFGGALAAMLGNLIKKD